MLVFLDEVGAHGYLVIAYHVEQVFLVLCTLVVDYAHHNLVVQFKAIVVEHLYEFLAALLYDCTAIVAHCRAQAGLALCCHQELFPVVLGLLRLRGEYLYLVATGKLVRQWHQLVVNLAGNAVGANLGVQRECHVKYRCVFGQCYKFALGGKHHYLTGKQVELDGIEEVECIGLGILEYVFNGLEPYCEFAFFLAFAYLVLPVCRKSSLGYVVHATAAYLHLYPLAIGTHHGDVQCAIAIGLGGAHPVAYAVGMQAIQVGDFTVYVPAYALLVALVVTLKHDACGIQVIDFLKWDVLGLHLLPYRVARLHSSTELIGQSQVVELLAYGVREAGKEFVTALFAGFNLLLDAGINLGVFILET